MNEPTTPESLIAAGVTSHRHGDFDAGITAAQEAFNLAETDSVDQGHAARDAGARCLKLGLYERANGWLRNAYDIHLRNVRTDSNRQAVRNLGASATMFATGNLVEHIENGTDPMNAPYIDILGPTRQAEHSLKQAGLFAKGLFKVDQFLINMARRLSILEAFTGNRRKAVAWGVVALAVAPPSESPYIDTSNKKLTSQERYRAKGKALVGGLGALTVAATARTRFDNTARKVAKKIL